MPNLLLSPEPQLEADGKGSPNTESGDIPKADIDLGLKIAENEWDAIREISPTQYIDDPNDIEVWVNLGEVSKTIYVYSIIIKTPYPFDPITQASELPFTNLGNGSYVLTLDKGKFKYENKSIGGKYILRVYAQDSRETGLPVISTPKQIQINYKDEDRFEPDDDPIQLVQPIYPPSQVQEHTLHIPEDQDWYFFFGHSGRIWPYSIEIEASSSIEFFLFDSNMVVVESESAIGKNISKEWVCLQDGFYYLMVGTSGLFPNEGIFYNISVEEKTPAGAPTTVFGQVLNANGEGVNGVGLEFYSTLQYASPKIMITRSINNNDGWYISLSVESGTYRVLITEGYLPNTIKKYSDTIIKEPFTVTLPPIQENRIKDIYLDINPISQNIVFDEDLQRAYNQWRDEKKFPMDGDNDNDGANNLKEFLQRTDPNNTDLPTIQCIFHQGLNLFPYYSFTTNDYLNYASDFLFDNEFNEGDSIWKYNQNNQRWELYSYSEGAQGIDFAMENSKIYLIYRNSNIQKSVDIDKDPALAPINPGLNLISLPIPDNSEYTSFDFLRGSHSGDIRNISRYNKQKKGKWEQTYDFFGHPAGTEFIFSPKEGYLVMQDGN